MKKPSSLSWIVLVILLAYINVSSESACDFFNSNKPPLIVITITPEIGELGTTFKISCSDSWDDKDDIDELQIRWDIYKTGEIDRLLIEEDIEFEYYPESIGTYQAQLKLTDRDGDQSFKIAYFEVIDPDNSGPTASFSFTPEEGTTQTTFQFDASSSSDPQTQNTDLMVRWDWTSDGLWDTDYSKDKTEEHKYSQAGEYDIGLQVIDEHGNESEITKHTIIVHYNSPDAPVADFTIEPEHGTTITDFDFDASISEDNVTPTEDLLFSWDVQNDGIWELELSDYMFTGWRYSEEGEYEVKLVVQDADGNTDAKIKTLSVVNCIDGGEPCGRGETVSYGGRIYNTVQIGYQCWMKENLDLGTFIASNNSQTDNHEVEKYCYDNDESFCAKYGGMYTWDEMMEYTTDPGVTDICPEGWHVPTTEEWDELADILGGPDMAGQKMKSCTDDWVSNNHYINTNESGFTALPGGNWDYNDVFQAIGTNAYFWSSSEDTYYGSQKAFHSFLSYLSDDLYGYEGGAGGEFKGYAMYVRCIKTPE